jgi:hypothetical protein
MFSNNFKPKLSFKYYCNSCDYGSDKKSNFENHKNSTRHKKSIICNQNKAELSSNHICEKCNKEYKDYSGLWRHRKKCKLDENENKNTDEIVNDKELIMLLIKENSELKNMMMKVIENGTHNVTNNNCNNKSFNLNFFLNETCKDAMNLTDFVNSLQLQLSDLEKVGEVGYIEGISSIIVKNLNALDVTERPIHCTDKKRETMYIKDENKWEKEDEKKDKMHKMIKKVSNKNINLISEFREKYPDYKKCNSNVSDQFNKIIIESMGGNGDNDYEKEEKIIKKIAKEVLINKE